MHLDTVADNFITLFKLGVMKKVVLTLFLLFSFSWAESQVIDSLNVESKQEIYDFHYAKSKKQKKTGFILLGSGIAATGAGLLIAANSNVLSDDGGFGTGAGLVLVGSVATVVSIPYLISSGVNKRRAAAYVQVGEFQTIDAAFQNSKLVSVGFKFDF